MAACSASLIPVLAVEGLVASAVSVACADPATGALNASALARDDQPVLSLSRHQRGRAKQTSATLESVNLLAQSHGEISSTEQEEEAHTSSSSGSSRLDYKRCWRSLLTLLLGSTRDRMDRPSAWGHRRGSSSLLFPVLRSSCLRPLCSPATSNAIQYLVCPLRHTSAALCSR